MSERIYFTFALLQIQKIKKKLRVVSKKTWFLLSPEVASNKEAKITTSKCERYPVFLWLKAKMMLTKELHTCKRNPSNATNHSFQILFRSLAIQTTRADLNARCETPCGLWWKLKLKGQKGASSCKGHQKWRNFFSPDDSCKWAWNKRLRSARQTRRIFQEGMPALHTPAQPATDYLENSTRQPAPAKVPCLLRPLPSHHEQPQTEMWNNSGTKIRFHLDVGAERLFAPSQQVAITHWCCVCLFDSCFTNFSWHCFQRKQKWWDVFAQKRRCNLITVSKELIRCSSLRKSGI